MRAAALPCVAALVAISAATPATKEQTRPVLLGRIEPAFAQKTPVGKQIATLEVFNGRMYAGYGDYSADSGPIAIVAVDLATGAIGKPVLSHATEAIHIFRQIGNALFAPDIDPRGTRLGGFARGVAGAPADTWTDEKVVMATHLFDVATFDGSDLWLFGSLRDDALAWRSKDGGKSWLTELTVRPWAVGSFSRFYSAFLLGGKLYTQAVDFPIGGQNTSLVYDGATWSPGPRLFPMEVARGDVFPWRPKVVGRQVIYLDNHSGTTYRDVRVYRFDGERAHFAYGPTDRHLTGDPQYAILDIATSGGTAYLINRRHQVLSSTDLVEWRMRTTFTGATGESATSIAVNGDDVYVGTSLANIYKVRIRPTP